MRDLREELHVGLKCVEVATDLLCRTRHAHPTSGLFEAADLQWWWRTPRASDDLPQLFWFDRQDRPEAAVIATEWGDGTSGVYDETSLSVIVLPDASSDVLEYVVDRGLAHVGSLGIGAVDIEVDRADDVMHELLIGRGFEVKGPGVTEAWIDADARPEICPLPHGYRSFGRHETLAAPHHMIGRGGPLVETRLRQTSLYRADLDLVVLDVDDRVAAYGLFWFDPDTSTGLVEPMRTEDGHQRRGLARHVLTTGIDRLTAAGANRIKICFDPDNAAAAHLYLSAGFEPVKQSDLYSGRTSGQDR
jgi:GNAT superfamily N-acetyltransferase